MMILGWMDPRSISTTENHVVGIDEGFFERRLTNLELRKSYINCTKVYAESRNSALFMEAMLGSYSYIGIHDYIILGITVELQQVPAT